MKRIFITGAAGFIGFHTAKAARARGDFVIGLDNFNTYYDPNLKRDRVKVLDIEVVEGDLQNRSLLLQILSEKRITHVIHLAAQAGVRHSMSHPDDYVASNLQGFVSLLEACRHFPHLKITYASSSSVYGLNTKIPFSEGDPTDKPANLYGATKKANEVMAHAYHHLYGLSLTGLRYFTVYGPWGRPDMAVWRFAEKIYLGEEIQIFNYGKMKRDFTYIDDIVDGTLAAVDLGASCELFNLGHNRPIPLLRFIDILEEAIGKKAIRTLLPMQPGEALETYADIEKSQRQLHFHPKVPLEEGIPLFTAWLAERQWVNSR